MNNYTFEDVYYSMLGEMEESVALSNVENAYTSGGECDRLYIEIHNACRSLCNRLGVPDEDADVELILGNFSAIQRILCERMFHYGQLFR